MKEFLTILLAFVVIVGGAAGIYFLLKKYFAADEPQKKGSKKPNANDKAKTEKEKAAADKKAVAAEKKAAADKAAAEKRKAEMMKKVQVQANPKVLEHILIKKAEEEITKFPQSIEKVTVRANRIDWTIKEEYSQYSSGNVFFDDPALHRLETGEMKLVAEHFFKLLKDNGFELEEIGSGEKGTHRYHVDEYVIKAI